MRPYIGITGFTTVGETLFAHQRIPHASSRDLMIGVLASYKSLRGIPMKERWAKQTPPLGAIPDIFQSYPGTLELIHYSGEETMLADMLHVEEVIADALGHYDGFQLNIAWPNPLALETFHRKTKGNRSIVLQLGREATNNALYPRVHDIAMRLWGYVGLVDALLFDMSGGEGKKLDVYWTREFLRAVHDAGLPFSFGIAGGLGPGALLDPVRELIKEFPNLSWDAQGQLRNGKNELDPYAVSAYLAQSFALVP